MKIRIGRKGVGEKSAPGIRDRTRTGPGGRIVGFLFGLPFFLLGSFFCWIGGLHPLLKVVDSLDWPEVPAVITHSEVDSHSGDDGSTYSVDINFRYTYGNRQYTGGSYDFSSGSSSGRKGKARIVRNHPVGKEVSCYVNPAQPGEAVLSRHIPGIVYFVIPFSSIFILVGLAIMLGSLGLLPEKWKNRVYSRHKRVSQLDEGERELKPRHSGSTKVLGSLFIACFWNGIVGVFVWQVILSFQRGNPQWFLVVFLIPFVAAGLFFVYLVIHNILALANPKFRLVLSEGNPRLGATVTLRWEGSGSLRRLEDLRIILEGTESATYRRGTRSVTDKSTFCRETVFNSDQAPTLPGGKAMVTIPVASMHSFNGGNNKVEWSIRLTGSIRRWPDIDDSYPLTVRPIKLT